MELTLSVTFKQPRANMLGETSVDKLWKLGKAENCRTPMDITGALGWSGGSGNPSQVHLRFTHR